MVYDGTSDDPMEIYSLTATLDILPIAVVFVDHTYTIRWINQRGENLFGRPRAVLIGQSVKPVDGGLWTWSHGPGLDEIMSACLGPKGPACGIDQDVTILGGSGPRQHHMTITASLLGLPDKRITLLTIQEGTPAPRGKESDSQTERLRLAIQRARKTAHELNQPLSVLVGNIELLMRQLDADHPVKTRISKISDSADRLTEMVHRLQMIIHAAKEPDLLKIDVAPLREESVGV